MGRATLIPRTIQDMKRSHFVPAVEEKGNENKGKKERRREGRHETSSKSCGGEKRSIVMLTSMRGKELNWKARCGRASSETPPIF